VKGSPAKEQPVAIEKEELKEQLLEGKNTQYTLEEGNGVHIEKRNVPETP